MWTAAAALAISHFAGWQYDGDIGWWLVVAYTFLALIAASPLTWLAGNGASGVVVCLVTLAAVTIVAAVALRRPLKSASGS